MFIEGNFISCKQSTLHYAKAGTGSLPLLLFHGFGQDYHAFQELTDPLADYYTLYSFDLYFHGKSEWNSDQPLDLSDWLQILELFFEKENIDRFAVAGYSLGGKFALATTALFPQRIEKLFLLAADGVRINFWYKFATWPLPVRMLFKSMIRHPGRFQEIVRLFGSLKIIHNGMLRFATSQMDTELKRLRVYNSWVMFRHIRISMKSMAALINQHPIALTVVTGSFDQMVPPKIMYDLLDHVTSSRSEILSTGHNGIISKSIKFFLPG